MNTMTISPLQQNYVTKTEFNEFSDKVYEQFGSVDKQFKSVNERFDAVDVRFNRLEKSIALMFLEQKRQMSEEMNNLRTTLFSDYERHTGMIHEQMKHDLKAALEQVEAKLDKKLSKDEFYEYMELHFPRQTKRKIKK